jgi:protease-4
MAPDLNALTTQLNTENWMVDGSSYTELVSSIALMQAKPDLQISGPKDEFKLEAAPAESGNVAVISVNGILVKGASPIQEAFLGLCNTDAITQAINAANEDNSVSEICLAINSPGGSTPGIQELGELIANNPKPIKGWVEIKCASAAYWLLSQCQFVGMTPSAKVGSVGVFSIVDNLTSAMDKAGIKKEIFSAGKYKMMGANFRELTKEEKEILQKDVSDQYEKFKKVILSKREVGDEFMQGLMYEGEASLKANMVDVVANNITEFLTNKPMIKTVKIENPAAAVVETAATQAVATPVTKQAADPAKEPEKETPEKKENVPGVPGTKMESGGYGKGYIECPSCKLRWKLEEKHMKDEEEKEKKAEKEEPKKEECSGKRAEKEEPEKKEAAPVVETQMASLSETFSAFVNPGYVKQSNSLADAIQGWKSPKS